MSKFIELSMLPRSRTSPTRWPILGQVLAFLVKQVTDDGKGDDSTGRTRTVIREWADDNYVYLEINLPRGTTLEADITISRGKAYVRLQK